MEDAAPIVFLAGWQVWQDKGNLGLAKTAWSAAFRTCSATTNPRRRTNPNPRPIS